MNNNKNKLKMKKVTYLLLTALLAACSNNTDNDPQPVEYGTISLGISNDESVTVSPREAATPEVLANYNITVKQGEDQKYNGKYSTLTTTYPAGTNYTVSAESCTDDEALTANSNWGQARYFGQTENSFEIKANENTAVAFTCTMTNTKVCVIWDPTISDNSFFSEYSVQLWEASNVSRSCTFGSTSVEDNPVAFFNIDSDPQLTGTVSYKFGGVSKTATISPITLKAKDYNKLTVKASGSNGGIALTITIDDTTTPVSTDIDINPYQ